MKQLWAPWRIEYILGKKPRGCILCEKPRERRDEENYILLRGKLCYVMLNAYPYNNGHLMISPYRHVVSFDELSDDECMEMMRVLRLSLVALRKALSPDGFNIGANLGKTAGAGMEHLHLHVVPRWSGDTNFMPVLAETKVISEHLRATYQKLKKAFDEVGV